MQDYSKALYGELPLHQSQDRPHRKRTELKETPSLVGETVLLRARVQTSRATGSRVFLLLRQKIDTIQALVNVTPEKVSKQMVKWVGSLQNESIVLLEGVVRKAEQEVKSATISDVEIDVYQVIGPIFMP